jgi:hypothetical protein
MDWNFIENRFHVLLEAHDRAWDKYVGAPTKENYAEYERAKQKMETFCTNCMMNLVVGHPEILEILKAL